MATGGSREMRAEAERTDRSVVGRPRLLRTINEQNVLTAVREAGTISRRDLASRAGLSKPTIGMTLENLIADDLVRVAGKQTGQRGPTALLYELCPDSAFVLSIDIGNEYLRGAIGDISGTVHARRRHAVHGSGWRFPRPDIEQLTTSLLEGTGIERDQITQAVVGAPGVYPAPDRVVSTPRASQWPRADDEGAPAAVLEGIVGADLLMENDVNLAALAELRRGHGTGVDTFVFLSIGTGFGLGLVLNGKIHTGAHGAAGEIGFLPVRDRSPGSGRERSDPIGIRASSFGIVRAARRTGIEDVSSARQVFDAAKGGDERAVAVVEHEAELVAEAVAWAVGIIDPELVVLGGGVGRSEGFAAAVTAAAARRLVDLPPIRTSALGEEGVVEGGLLAGLDRAWQSLLGTR